MSRPEPSVSEQTASRWPHRLAWVLACATFLLIWVGGNVTAYQAGMAIPDWPTTYGHWLYPIPRWLGTHWDLFLEQGHRMLAQLVVPITIVLAVVLWVKDRRKGMRWLAAAAVLGVLLQATLGGLRVVGDDVVAWLEATKAPGMSVLRLIGDEVLLRRMHGCNAPLFFALCTALVTLTSRPWLQHEAAEGHAAARRLQRMAWIATLGIYLMIILGAQLRHQPAYGGPGGFEVWHWLKSISGGLIANWYALWIGLKLGAALLVAIGLGWLLIDVLRHARRQPRIVRRVKLLAVLFFVQLVLAAAVWVTNYGWPAWFTYYVWAVEYTVVAEGRLQVVMRTTHSALGCLTLIAALSLTLWSFRLLRGES